MENYDSLLIFICLAIIFVSDCILLILLKIYYTHYLKSSHHQKSLQNVKDSDTTKKAKDKKSSVAPPDSFPEIIDFPNMTLRQITDLFGTDAGFKTWLEARRMIEEIKVKEVGRIR